MSRKCDDVVFVVVWNDNDNGEDWVFSMLEYTVTRKNSVYVVC